MNEHTLFGYEHNPDAPLETAAGNYLETVEGYQIWGYADRISGDDSLISEIQYYNYDQQVRIYFDNGNFSSVYQILEVWQFEIQDLDGNVIPSAIDSVNTGFDVEENDHLSITLNTGVLLEAGISESQDLKTYLYRRDRSVWWICS